MLLEDNVLSEKINIAFNYNPLYELTKKLRTLGYTYDILVKLNEEGRVRCHPAAREQIMSMIKGMDPNPIFYSHDMT